MSLATVRHLHADMEKIVATMGTNPADDAMVAIFNANLAETKRAHPDNRILAALAPAAEGIHIGYLFIRVGQLQVILQEILVQEHRLQSARNQQSKGRPGTGA